MPVDNNCYSILQVGLSANIFRKRLLASGSLCAFFLFVTFTSLLSTSDLARAEYPDASISLSVPVAEGNQLDSFFTQICNVLQEKSEQRIKISYFPGKSGGYSVSSIADASPNGYTLTAVILPSYQLVPRANARMYDEWEIDLVSILAYCPIALWVDENSPLKSVADLVAFERELGNKLYIAGTGTYTDHHMANLVFSRTAGVKAVYIPFAGSKQAAESVKNGMATAVWAYALADGSMQGMRPIAVATPDKCTALPEIQTFREQKIELVCGAHIGIGLPAGKDEKLRLAVSNFFASLNDDTYLFSRLTKEGFYPMTVPYQDIPAFMEKQSKLIDELIANYPIFTRQELEEYKVRLDRYLEKKKKEEEYVEPEL